MLLAEVEKDTLKDVVIAIHLETGLFLPLMTVLMHLSYLVSIEQNQARRYLTVSYWSPHIVIERFKHLWKLKTSPHIHLLVLEGYLLGEDVLRLAVDVELLFRKKQLGDKQLECLIHLIS